MTKEDRIKKQLAKVNKTLFKANFLTNQVMSGEYSSAFKGQGLEFNEVREYMIGDDVRTIDWNVTARTGKPYVKSFNEERELSVMVMVDASQSMFFGSGEEARLERAAAISAFLSFSAIKNNDKVGLIIFNESVEKYIPYKKGKSHIWNIINELVTFQPQGKSSNLEGALEFLLKVINRKTIVFIISDFYLTNYEKSIKVASKRHDIIAIRLKERFEEALPDVGLIEITDFESGGKYILDTGNTKTRETFIKNLEEYKNALQVFLKKNKIDLIEIGNNDNVSKEFYAFFKNREKKFLKFH
ncbi:MAG: DUF58 domain-containing protein [Nitrospinae bacterium]|nr:DUF58 domain-containing protein [Nitrospinota bacterium]